MNGLLDGNGNPFMGLVAMAREDLTDNTILGTMLDGSYSVQMVSSPSRKIDVEFYCSNATRILIQNAKAYGDRVTVIWKEVAYSGYIDDIKFKSFWPKKSDRQMKIDFTLLVEESSGEL